MPIQTLNPATGELVRTFESLESDALAAKIALAHASIATYAEVPLTHRALYLRKLAGLLDHECEELAALMTLEMGKTLAQSRLEIAKCARCCRYYAQHAQEILADEYVETEGQESFVRSEPLGVVLAIMPWNFPLWQVFRFLAPALMAGNISLLKHASNVPQCSLAIEALVRRAGFPRGCHQSLLIEARQVETVLADERIAAVTLTGSESAGRAVGAQAGWLLKKSVLELGGSDPFIVLPSADLAAAVENAVRARIINNGQSCIAAKRFIVHREVYDDFEQQFVSAMEALKTGDPMLPETAVGPLATAQGLVEIEAQIAAATSAGARILTGGKRIVGPGFFFEPTVLSGVPRSTAVYRDEIFGPVAMLFPAESLEEAIEIANDTPFGLGASAWTTDPEEQQRLIAGLHCGGVFLNTPVASDPRLPFGGIKRSGYGRELASAGMREFLNLKTVTVAQTSTEDKGRAEEETLDLSRSDYDSGKFSKAFKTAT